jgi:hypothetical protein
MIGTACYNPDADDLPGIIDCTSRPKDPPGIGGQQRIQIGRDATEVEKGATTSNRNSSTF